MQDDFGAAAARDDIAADAGAIIIYDDAEAAQRAPPCGSPPRPMRGSRGKRVGQACKLEASASCAAGGARLLHRVQAQPTSAEAADASLKAQEAITASDSFAGQSFDWPMRR